MPFNFYKYQGAGNDFIIIDDRKGDFWATEEQIAELCHRRFGIGADGLMLLQRAEGYDFRMVYFNADGRESSMCGNGGRCIAAFAWRVGIGRAGEELHFIAIDGEHRARLVAQRNDYMKVALQMKDVPFADISERADGSYVLDTGSPHYVAFLPQLKGFDAKGAGQGIRYSEEFAREGINVNFVESRSATQVDLCTYERGVEDLTYACGTGATAVAIVQYLREQKKPPVHVHTQGGLLTIDFVPTATGFEQVWLTGDTMLVFEGWAAGESPTSRP